MRSTKLTTNEQRTSQRVEEASTLQIWPGGFALYEISTRPWLYSLSKKHKRPITKLADIPDEEFLALKDRGFPSPSTFLAKAPALLFRSSLVVLGH